MTGIPGRTSRRGDPKGAPSYRGRIGRPLLFLALSLALHIGGAAAVALLIRDLWTPPLHVTWLDLDNRLGAPWPAPPVPPPPKRPEPEPARPRPRPPEPAPRGERGDVPRPPRPHPAAAAKASPARASGSGSLHADQIALADLAPGDAALMLLLRMDRIRRSPYEASVRRLLEVFYDHKTILWGSGLDPVNDFEAVLIATPNPYRVTETFLAARCSRSSGELRAGLERAASFGAGRLRWVPAPGGALRGEIPSPPRLPADPRVLWLGGDVVLLTDPKQLAGISVAGPAPDARDRKASVEGVDRAERDMQARRPEGRAERPRSKGERAVEGAPGPSWLGRLTQMGERGGARGGGPAMLLQAVNLARLVVLPPELPAPQNAQIGIEARDPARVEAVLTFPAEAAARSFLAEVRRRIERVRQSDDRASRLLRWLGVADLLSAIRLQRAGAVVTASTQLADRDVQALLEMVRAAIPQVKVPGMPDRRPVDAGPPRPDLAAPSSPDAGPVRLDRQDPERN